MDIHNQQTQFNWGFRRILFVVVCAVCVANLTGCQLMKRRMKMGSWLKPPAPNVLRADITLPEVVDYLNANSTRIRSWKSDDVRLTVNPPGAAIPAIRLSSIIAVEAPRSFRLRAHNAFAEADLGSNQEALWFFVRPSPEESITMAKHTDIPMIQRYANLPFDPDWLMEVLGVVPFDHTKMSIHHYGKKREYCALSYVQTGPDGKRYYRIVRVSKALGQIIEHRLVDDGGNLIAKAEVSDHRPIQGVVLPHQFRFEWPQTKNKMSLKIAEIEINKEMEPEMWTMPGNMPVIDLGARIAQQMGTHRPGDQFVEVPEFADAPNFESGQTTEQTGGVQFDGGIQQIGYQMPAGSSSLTDEPVFEDAAPRPERPGRAGTRPVQQIPDADRRQQLQRLRRNYRNMPDFN